MREAANEMASPDMNHTMSRQFLDELDMMRKLLVSRSTTDEPKHATPDVSQADPSTLVAVCERLRSDLAQKETQYQKLFQLHMEVQKELLAKKDEMSAAAVQSSKLKRLTVDLEESQLARKASDATVQNLQVCLLRDFMAIRHWHPS